MIYEEPDKLPSARSKHATFVHNKRMYIHGGMTDDGVVLDCLYSIDLKTLEMFYTDYTEYIENPVWIKSKQIGKNPFETDVEPDENELERQIEFMQK